MTSTRPSTPQCSGVPRPVLPDEARRVGVVDHDQRVVALGEVADRLQVGDVAVHREDAVGRDDHAARAGRARLLQLRLEVLQVHVLVAEAVRLAEADAVDDRGVVERVGDDRVLLAEQRLEEAAVRVEARRVEDRVVRPEERRERLLELAVAVLRAADEAHGRQAVAALVERRLGRRERASGGSRGPR